MIFKALALGRRIQVIIDQPTITGHARMRRERASINTHAHQQYKGRPLDRSFRALTSPGVPIKGFMSLQACPDPAPRGKAARGPLPGERAPRCQRAPPSLPATRDADKRTPFPRSCPRGEKPHPLPTTRRGGPLRASACRTAQCRQHIIRIEITMTTCVCLCLSTTKSR